MDTKTEQKKDSWTKAFDHMEKAFDAASDAIEAALTSSGKVLKEALDESTKSFNKGFDEAFQEASTQTMELYGITKAEALLDVNQHAQSGYKLVSIEEDAKRGVWVAKLQKPGFKVTF